MLLRRSAVIAIILICSALVSVVPASYAGGVVTDCADDAQFAALLDSGGTITFNCNGAGAPATIIISSDRTVTADTVINGGGVITLSGNNARRIFTVNAGIALTLNGLTLAQGNEVDGGAIKNHGKLFINNSTLSNNHASFAFGGAIQNNGAMTVTNSLLRNNSAANGYGGAIDSAPTSGLVVVIQSRFENNYAKLGGGAIANNGSVRVHDSTFASNWTDSYQGLSGGGAIENTGPLTIERSTFSGNRAGKGGGVYNEGGTAIIINSTFSGNSVNAAPRTGGAVHNQLSTNGLNTPGVVTLVANTFSANTASAGTGGNLSNSSGNTLRVKLSIVAAGAPNNCAGTIISQDNNLDSANTCGFTLSDDLINTDPLLGPLADNGGSTWTQALQAGSAAIDHVMTSCTDQQGLPLDADQRGLTRPQDGDDDGVARCDVGAFELQTGNTPTPTNTATPTRTATPRRTPTSTRTATPTLTPVIIDCNGSLCVFLPVVLRTK